MPHFSPREQDVLHLVADLHSYEEMRSILKTTEGTLGSHVSSLLAKTDTHKHIELASWALQHGYGCRYSVTHAEPCHIAERFSLKPEPIKTETTVTWRMHRTAANGLQLKKKVSSKV